MSVQAEHADNPKFRQGRYFLMQADVEAGWSTERFTVAASFGRINSLIRQMTTNGPVLVISLGSISTIT